MCSSDLRSLVVLVNATCRPSGAQSGALAFVCVGLETRFVDLLTTDRGRPALAFLGAQTINVFWTLLLAWLLFGGVIFAQPAIR